MQTFVKSLIASLLILGAGVAASADDEDALERAAGKLLETTVTVRMSSSASSIAASSIASGSVTKADKKLEAKEDQPSGKDVPAKGAESARLTPQASTTTGITVCSGVLLAEGKIVTSLRPADDAQFRITLPNGDQAEASLLVVDRYSGLAVLATGRRDLASLAPAEGAPKIGATLLSAAAWGNEKPVVSHGILSGADRSIPRADLPPLLQCDLRIAQTSAGAAVVDKAGGLVGIVVAAEPDEQRAGWTYAIPASHVARLLRVPPNKKKGPVIIERRSPVAGLVMVPGIERDTVVVERVTPGGPADKAGIKKGDVVIGADGVKLRHPYEARRLVLNRQPGDQIQFVIDQQGQQKNVALTLGGGNAQPDVAADMADDVKRLIDPKVAVGPSEATSKPVSRSIAADGDRTANGQVKLLEEACSRYLSMISRQLKAIEDLQSEMNRRDAENRLLRLENVRLKALLEKSPDAKPEE